MKIAASHSSKQSYEEYQKRMSKLIKVPIKLSDILEARAARKKENLSSTSADGDKKKYVEFKCPLDPDGDLDDDSNVYKTTVKVLSTTSSVIEYCEFCEDLAHLCDAKAISNDHNADENARKCYNLARTCMRDNALIEFQAIHDQKMQANNALPNANRRAYRTILREVFHEFAKKIFVKPDQAYKIQKRYLKTSIWMGTLKNEEFCTILEMIDRWLPYYPLYGPNENTVPLSLTEDEKIEILDNVKKVEWLPIMGMRGQYPFQFQSYDELKDFYTELEDAIEVQQEVAKHGKTESTSNKRKRSENRGSEAAKSSGKGSDKKNITCGHCGKKGHSESECWSKPGNEKLRPKNAKKPPAQPKQDKEQAKWEKLYAIMMSRTKIRRS
jgi:hypothetical protein